MSGLPKFRLKNWIYGVLPLLLFFVAWDAMILGSTKREFFLGSPRAYVVAFLTGLFNGSLAWDTLLTGGEAVLGFLAGNVVGAIAGFMLWKWPSASRALKPYITLLGAARRGRC